MSNVKKFVRIDAEDKQLTIENRTGKEGVLATFVKTEKGITIDLVRFEIDEGFNRTVVSLDHGVVEKIKSFLCS